MTKMPEIDRDKCDGCGLCVEACCCHVLVLVNDVVEVRERMGCQQCSKWCTTCEMVCPVGAIQCLFEVITEE